MSDADSRTLVILKEKGSTARLLNLLRFYVRPEGPPEGAPMFKNRLLRRAIVSKQCIAANDSRSFSDGRRHATKIILPLNAEDLRLGGRYFLLGQNNYADVRREVWGDAHEDRDHDEQILKLLDGAPSLDPFLLREVFQRSQLRIDPAFLELSENDQQEMFDFARTELAALAAALFGEGADADMQARLVRKLLFNDESGQIEPLRLALRLDEDNYAEGMFAWKGFLYFKWRYFKIVDEAPEIARELRKVFTTGDLDSEEKAAIRETRDEVASRLIELIHSIPPYIEAYDNALAELTGGGDATAFRDFLLDSPRIFLALGERMGVLDHILSVWRFMFPEGKKPVMPGSDLMELLTEYETLVTRFKYETPASVSAKAA